MALVGHRGITVCRDFQKLLPFTCAKIVTKADERERSVVV